MVYKRDMTFVPREEEREDLIAAERSKKADIQQSPLDLSSPNLRHIHHNKKGKLICLIFGFRILFTINLLIVVNNVIYS